MAFDFTKAKRLARQTVHDTLAVQAFYKDESLNASISIKARYHTKVVPSGEDGMAMMLEGVERIVFDAAEARKLNVKRGGEVTFTSLGSGLGVDLGSPLGGEDVGPSTFILLVKIPPDGPFKEVWEVSRK